MSLEEGEARKAQGIEAVLANEREQWKSKVHNLLVILLRNSKYVVSDDLRNMCTDAGISEPHHPNVWGGIFAGAVKEGLMERDDTRHRSEIASNHARVTAVWISLIYKEKK